MITNIKIENFKKLESVSFQLSSSVVIIGPNNSGKSTIFQALCLWEIGVRKYVAAKEQGKLNKSKRIILNRKDLLNSPIEDAQFLWTDGKTTHKKNAPATHIILAIELEGETNNKKWKCRAEFYYYNTESFSCGITTGLDDIIELYNNTQGIHFGFLQPMSGISTSEDKLTQGSIDRKMGEGKTAEVLRNICFEMLNPETSKRHEDEIQNNWKHLSEVIKSMFGVTLEKPQYIKSTGLIQLRYKENNVTYDISSGGRGFLQSLLLFSYMYVNPNTVLLLDEPDAHLEVIRQRETFQRINEIADQTNSQVLIASHSEVVLDQAAEASKVIALIEHKTYELNTSTKSQSLSYIKKALTDIGWETYYYSRAKGHILFLEGSTDLDMLLAFANKLKHKVEPLLRTAHIRYTANNLPHKALSYFVPLKEIFPELKGLALFDRLGKSIDAKSPLKIISWERRELENYFARPVLLVKHAKMLSYKYTNYTSEQLKDKMKQAIANYTPPAYLNDLNNSWWDEAKLSDDWLDLIFPEFYKQLGIPADFFKRDYYRLINLMKVEDISAEISEKLDAIYDILDSPRAHTCISH
ncbi:ATP-dependent nuclease [Bacteroides sp. UBA939]|uniref:ATP-dependent nuclease n=1 Tax=Bacteroides sp. UBA939 TaxID=1946092 RepID=UPI0025B8D24B|nr:AAA family ATPase [Bacteroides sp. UBA939]